jgi:hypothetical protein
MSVSSIRDTDLENVVITKKFRVGSETRTLSGTLTLTVNNLVTLFLDPGGSARDVVLPAEADSEGLLFNIVNMADNAEALTVKNDAGSTIATVSMSEGVTFHCNGTAWRAMVSQDPIGGVGTADITDDAVTNAKLANITRGSVKVGGTADAPTDLDAKTSGQILVGDGTDVKSVAVSGDVTLSAAGAVTIAKINNLATAAEVNRACDLSARVVPLAVSTAITEVAHEGRTILMSGAGSARTFTLPAATGSGGRYRFVVGEVNTSGYLIKAVAGSQLFKGMIIGASTTDSATDAARTWIPGATDDTVTLNGTTTGGVSIGGWVEFEDLSATHWEVRGVVTQSGTEASPFSDTVA